MAYSVSWSPAADDRTLGVTVTASDSVDLTKIPQHVLYSPVVDFANLGACGGLSGHLAPESARSSVVSSALLGARQMQCIVNIENLSPRCLENLLGAVGYFDWAIGALQSVEITAPNPMLAARDSAPAGHFNPLPFTLEDDRQYVSDGLSIQVDFGASVAADTMAKLEEDAFGIWFCAASAGCFCDVSFTPDLCKIYLGERRYWSDRIELNLDKIILSVPEAIDSLINVFVWAHHHIVPIKSVALYE